MKNDILKKKNIMVLLGFLMVATSLIISPELVTKYFSNDGVITTNGLRALTYYKLILFIIGIITISNLKIKNFFYIIEKKEFLPKNTLQPGTKLNSKFSKFL